MIIEEEEDNQPIQAAGSNQNLPLVAEGDESSSYSSSSSLQDFNHLSNTLIENLALLSTNPEPVFLTKRVIPRRFNVLIVDDSGYNIYVMKLLLETIPLSIDVSTAFNGVEALEIVQMHNCPPRNVIRV